MFPIHSVLLTRRGARLSAWGASCVLALALALSPLAASAAQTVLVFGDSLSAGYGLRQEAAWPSLLAARLQREKPNYNVVNASISGETTAGGLARLGPALTRYRPAVVVLALGSNDGLRGLPIAAIRANLSAMADAAGTAHARVLIVGQRLPPNFGPYAADFERLFGEVARAKKAALVDFLLAGVATRPELFQADTIHPTAEAQPLLLDNVWRGLSPLLK